MSSLPQPIGWHITQRLEDSRNIVRDVTERRILARTLLEVGRERGLFLFSVPDTHVHVATTVARVEAGKLAHALACALRYQLRLPVPFEPARFKPIAHQSHLLNVVPYILGNGPRHGNQRDPLCEGTNLPDLLGLRVTGAYTAWRLVALLPRLARGELLTHLDIDALEPGSNARFLADAAAASVALPSLSVRGSEQRSAALAAVHVARRLGLSTIATAKVLGLCPRTVSRLRGEQPHPALVRAIDLQLGLMEAHATRRRTPDWVRERAEYA